MISIVIPTLIRSEQDVVYFQQLLDSIQKQIHVKYEVIVSDNTSESYDPRELSLICKLDYHSLNIKYVHNPIVGASENFNFGISHASYDKIKIMCQDDLLSGPLALNEFSQALNNHQWAVCNSVWINEKDKVINYHNAHWNNDMLKGTNSIGMPSVMAFKKNEFRFDPNLKTLIDCEFYWWMMEKKGPPKWLTPRLVAQRFHPGSTSNNQTHHGAEEYEYLKTKWNIA